LADQHDVEAIKRERQKVYGDPRENHRGIAQGWAGLLQPHAERIARGDPIPEWCVALMMAALKLNRMRRIFKQDNYDDLTAYAGFAEQWQREDTTGVLRVYVAGPYSAPIREIREQNTARAAEAATEVMRRGHDAFCPHTMSHPIEELDTERQIGYESYMRTDFGIIDRWATALLFLAPSPGADRELERATKLGLRIFHSIDEVPDLRKSAA
jgi:hypothetical protein